MDLLKLYSSQNVKTYWDARKEAEEQYVGVDELFGSEKQLEDTIEAITGASGYTPALLLNSPDSKTVYRERGELTVSQKKIPFFKEGMQVDEKHIIDLMKLEGNPNQSLVTMVKQRMFNESMELYRSSRMTREIMANQLLSTGAISMASNGASFTADYNVPAKNKVTLTTNKKWNATGESATVDVLADIRAMKKLAKINGEARAICNSTTFGYIVNDKKVQGLLKNQYGVADLTDEIVIDLIYARTKVRLYVNDTYYKKNDGTDGQVFPDNVISLFPQGELGKFVFAMTPEERVLLNGNTTANVSVVDEGIAITTQLEADAVSIQTKISMRCLPRLDILPDQIVIYTVA